MFELRPHKLQVMVPGAGGGINEYGDPVPVSPASWSETISCRFVQDEKANTRIQPDGTLRFYQYCVLLDDIKTNYDNKVIRLFDTSGNLVVERMVDCSKRGQLIQRLWL